jgi:hypothetical protein
MDLRFVPPPRHVLVVAAALLRQGINDHEPKTVPIDELVETTGYARRTVYLALEKLSSDDALEVRDVGTARSFRCLPHKVWDAARAVTQP